MQLIKERDIAIEVNPISNQVLGLVEDLRNHPASALVAQDYPVVVTNDDPALWNAVALSYDFYEAFVGIMPKYADLRALKKLARNSIKYSNMNETEKSRAMKVWNDKWNIFLENQSKNLNV